MTPLQLHTLAAAANEAALTRTALLLQIENLQGRLDQKVRELQEGQVFSSGFFQHMGASIDALIARLNAEMQAANDLHRISEQS